ncbi:8-oxo-dGTP diphosphatase [Effusibacillus lacus]|uniref:7,8-dihydro-8-oxoguanine triphosphatase n=1 Tax=Effusibacillus lacus TaxID=1348429 RepID=A0A292YQW1_9BACL|nr:8-oxo-dGTP diphosphatase [Effusibacillus lacus]TCS74209.1 8-oxo-dGTP diphosphatase [Effusibacillus lacus]GAX90794.1 7,8-dihydro-8-oxoguanine triphosphatase [Effusibacillus lacus]
MQMVANCILRRGDQLLMLQKPRRGWWVVPGGKVETGESLYEAAIREYREETGLTLVQPELRGVFTVLLEEGGNLVNHWMLFTFYAESFTGRLHKVCEEGHLEWVGIDTLQKRPMAEGDRIFLAHILEHPTLLTGKFTYTPDYELLEWKPESSMPVLR